MHGGIDVRPGRDERLPRTGRIVRGGGAVAEVGVKAGGGGARGLIDSSGCVGGARADCICAQQLGSEGEGAVTKVIEKRRRQREAVQIRARLRGGMIEDNALDAGAGRA